MTGPILEGDALRAVEHRGSHLQIIAAAGSGKTEVVSQRVAHLLASDEEPRSIVAFTFTERAATEPDTGVLLVGDCGAGKTTLSLSLIKAGWRYVGDDSVMLQMVDDAAGTPAGKGPDQSPDTELSVAPSRQVGVAAHAVRRRVRQSEA